MKKMLMAVCIIVLFSLQGHVVQAETPSSGGLKQNQDSLVLKGESENWKGTAVLVVKGGRLMHQVILTPKQQLHLDFLNYRIYITNKTTGQHFISTFKYTDQADLQGTSFGNERITEIAATGLTTKTMKNHIKIIKIEIEWLEGKEKKKEILKVQ